MEQVERKRKINERFKNIRPCTAWSGDEKIADFDSVREAGIWVIAKNKLETKNIKSAASLISRAIICNISAYGYTWTSTKPYVKRQRRGDEITISDFSNKNSHLISETEVRQTFKIKKMATWKSFVSEKLIPQPADIIENEAFYKRKDIYEMVGLKEIPGEPFVTPFELGQRLGISDPKDVVYLVKYRKIPFYYLKKAKGSPRYFLWSEVEACLGLNNVKWNSDFPAFVAKNFFIRNILNTLLTLTVTDEFTEKELSIFNKIVIEGKTPVQIAREEGRGYPSEVTRMIARMYPKVMKGIELLGAGFKQVDILAKTNQTLNEENLFLKDQLKKLESVPVSNSVDSIEPIEDEFLPVRVKGLFSVMGIKSLFEISQLWRRDDAKKFRNVGEGTLKEVDALLKEKGLSWKTEAAPMVEKINLEAELENLKQATRNIDAKIKRIEGEMIK